MISPHEMAADFKGRFGREPHVFSAPGRVNLIGEHTDYNQGFVLPFAIDKRTYVAAALRDDDMIRAHTVTLDESTELRLGAAHTDDKAWPKYIHGVAEVLRQQGIVKQGADLLIDSDIPFGAGLSSSAALEISLGLALTTLAGRDMSGRDLAFAGQKVEHEFVGVRSGIMDQFASALAVKGHALFIDCRSTDVRQIPLDLGTAILAICNTGVKHSLAASEYNKRREECEQGVAFLKERMGWINSLRDVSLDQLDDLSNEMSETIHRRCRHVITENARTLAAVAALERGDLVAVGQLMYASHESLRDDYEVSCAELDLLVETSRNIPGVLGSRMTGGGFGGCTINLVESAKYDEFTNTISKVYSEGFGKVPEITVVEPSGGARQES